MNPKPTVGLAVIADEVLMGEVADQNITWISTELFRLGADLGYCCVMPDDLDFLVEHLTWMKERFRWVVTTGGIGATHDDLTRQVMADIFQVPLMEAPEAIAALEERVGGELNRRQREMAMVPKGAELIVNPLTAAPGFVIGNVIVLPGIPRLVQAMFPALEGRLRGIPVHRVELKTTRFESEIAPLLEEAQGMFPEVKIGSYPRMVGGGFRVRLVLRSRNDQMLKRAEEFIQGRIDR